MIYTSSKIYISESKIPGAGRGVFAACTILKGELIERCPVIIFPEKSERHINKTFLVKYLFKWKGEAKCCLALGFGSLYNHSITPNSKTRFSYKNQCIDFKATCTIEQGQEICHDYKWGNDPKDIG